MTYSIPVVYADILAGDVVLVAAVRQPLLPVPVDAITVVIMCYTGIWGTATIL